jgi:hypothetical protein
MFDLDKFVARVYEFVLKFAQRGSILPFELLQYGLICKSPWGNSSELLEVVCFCICAPPANS